MIRSTAPKKPDDMPGYDLRHFDGGEMTGQAASLAV
jgi:hypothetical protein